MTINKIKKTYSISLKPSITYITTSIFTSNNFTFDTD